MPLRLPNAQDRNAPQRSRQPSQRLTAHQLSHMHQDQRAQQQQQQHGGTHSRHPSRHHSAERQYDPTQTQTRPSRGILQNTYPPTASEMDPTTRAIVCPPKVYHRVCAKGTIPPQLEGPPGAVKAVCPAGTRPAQGKFYDLYDQYGNPYVPVEPTRIQRKYIRLIMFLLYILSIIIMIWDLVVNVTEVVIFYMICNAILLFRVFGVFWLTRALHFITFIVVVLLFALIDWDNVNWFNAMCCLIPLVIVLLFSLHMVFFRPGRTSEERANRASCHALTGLLVVFVIFWVVCFLINFNDLQCILEMIYLFLFLIIVLTPHFQTKSHAAVKARKECERNYPECRRRYEPCPSPSCCVPTKPCCNIHQEPFVCPEPGGVQNAHYSCCDGRSRSNVRRTRSHDRLDRRRSSSHTSLCGRRKKRSRSEESLKQHYVVGGGGGAPCACASGLVPNDSISLPDETGTPNESTTCVTHSASHPTEPCVQYPCSKTSRTIRSVSAPSGRQYCGPPQPQPYPPAGRPCPGPCAGPPRGGNAQGGPQPGPSGGRPCPGPCAGSPRGGNAQGGPQPGPSGGRPCPGPCASPPRGGNAQGGPRGSTPPPPQQYQQQQQRGGSAPNGPRGTTPPPNQQSPQYYQQQQQPPPAPLQGGGGPGPRRGSPSPGSPACPCGPSGSGGSPTSGPSTSRPPASRGGHQSRYRGR